MPLTSLLTKGFGLLETTGSPSRVVASQDIMYFTSEVFVG